MSVASDLGIDEKFYAEISNHWERRARKLQERRRGAINYYEEARKPSLEMIHPGYFSKFNNYTKEMENYESRKI